jgi:hypothetical protein
MKELEKAIKQLQKLEQQFDGFCEEFSVDGLLNLQRRTEAIRRERDQYKEEILEFISLLGLKGYQQRSNAVARLKKLTESIENDLSNFPEVFLTPPRHWIEGMPATRSSKGIPPMYPRVAEERLSLHVWPYINKLMQQLSKVTEIEKERTLEHFEELFLSLPPQEFTSRLWARVHDYTEYEVVEEETSLPLVDLLNLCVGYFPDQLLEDCRQRGEEAGYISAGWAENLDSKYTTANTAEAREDVARKVLIRFIYRVSGGEGIPLPEQETNIARKLSTERWNPFGAEWIVSDDTRLEDLLEPFAN